MRKRRKERKVRKVEDGNIGTFLSCPYKYLIILHFPRAFVLYEFCAQRSDLTAEKTVWYEKVVKSGKEKLGPARYSSKNVARGMPQKIH